MPPSVLIPFLLLKSLTAAFMWLLNTAAFCRPGTYDWKQGNRNLAGQEVQTSHGDVTATSPEHSMQQQKWNGVQLVAGSQYRLILSKYLLKIMSTTQQSCGNKKHIRRG